IEVPQIKLSDITINVNYDNYHQQIKLNHLNVEQLYFNPNEARAKADLELQIEDGIIKISTNAVSKQDNIQLDAHIDVDNIDLSRFHQYLTEVLGNNQTKGIINLQLSPKIHIQDNHI